MMQLFLLWILRAATLAQTLNVNVQRAVPSSSILSTTTDHELPTPTSTSQTQHTSSEGSDQVHQWSKGISYTTALSSHNLRIQDRSVWNQFPSWASIVRDSDQRGWGYGDGATLPDVFAARNAAFTSIDNPLSTVSSTSTRSSTSSSVSTESPTQESLDNYDRNLNWHLDVTVGGNSYGLLFDTGSSDLWIQKSEFEPSPTFDPVSDLNFNITYTGGSTVNGPVGNDTVAFAGLTVTQQLIAVPTLVSATVLKFCKSVTRSEQIAASQTDINQITGQLGREWYRRPRNHRHVLPRPHICIHGYGRYR